MNLTFRSLTILVALFVCLNSHGGEGVGASEASRTWQQIAGSLEESVPRLMTEKRVPGLTIALVQDSRVVWHRSYGVRSSMTGELVSDDTLFEAASLSKPVFAYAVLRLIESRKLDLDVPLVTYLRDARISNNPLFDYAGVRSDPLLQKITARHVLSHTAGLPNWNKPLKVYFTPGEKFSYSGQGFVMLQFVAEHLSGQPLEQMMQEVVFKPLGMNSSSFICNEECRRLKANGHTSSGQVVTRDLPGSNAASSLHTTARDYATFLLAVMNRKGLKEESFRRMTTPQVRVDEGCVSCIDRGTGRLSETISWGLGWGLQKTREDSGFWHWGNNAGLFNAYTQVSQTQRRGLIVLTNSGNGLALAGEIVVETFGRAQPALDWVNNR